MEELWGHRRLSKVLLDFFSRIVKASQPCIERIAFCFVKLVSVGSFAHSQQFVIQLCRPQAQSCIVPYATGCNLSYESRVVVSDVSSSESPTTIGPTGSANLFSKKELHHPYFVGIMRSQRGRLPTFIRRIHGRCFSDPFLSKSFS